MSFQQCTSMHLLREELVYQVTPEDLSAAAASKTWGKGDAGGPGANGRSRAASGSSCGCLQCREPCRRYKAPEQPRWGADRDLICCYYDAGRRIEQIRRARGHVNRTGFEERLQKICAASSEKLDAAVQSLGPNASLKDALRSPAVDQDVRDALSELMVFTSEVLAQPPVVEISLGVRLCTAASSFSEEAAQILSRRSLKPNLFTWPLALRICSMRRPAS